METGIELITKERQRQIEKLGWSASNDDEYDREELLTAARCYMISAEACMYSKNNVTYAGGFRKGEGVPKDWSWGAKYWKPSGDPIRDLERAGALIAAEIDRLLRAQKSLI